MSTIHHAETDASGKIEVSIFREEAQVAGSKSHLTVQVDDDMVCVGGGGVASAEPGAFLTTSCPTDNDLKGWRVTSTDHSVVDEHRLVAYAFGLKIEGMNRPTLFNHLEIIASSSTMASQPQRTAELTASPLGEQQSGILLIGGGFAVMPSNKANLAIATHPVFLRGWRSWSKDHFVPSPADITSYAIGIRELLPVGRIVVGVASDEGTQSHRPEARAQLSDEFALTGLGALLHWTDPGCLIWKLAPWLERDGT